jgi:hypothetical protein
MIKECGTDDGFVRASRLATFRTSGASVTPTPAPLSSRSRVLLPPRMPLSTAARRLRSSTGARASDRVPRLGYVLMDSRRKKIGFLTDIAIGDLGKGHPATWKQRPRPCQVRSISPRDEALRFD